MTPTLNIATRQSPLAMWQAEHVAQTLRAYHPDCHVNIIGMSTRGDEILDKSLSKIGGKGLFVKALETALIEGRADIAVHSMKDVGVDLPAGLEIGAILERHSPLDAVVANRKLSELPAGAVVGTSSLRRMCQLSNAYPNLSFQPLRGNIHTRLAKLDAGEFDAIILAESGLARMGLDTRIIETLSPKICLPGIAQGTLGIECRRNDTTTLSCISPLVDTRNTLITLTERGVNEILRGSCQTPLAAFAEWIDDERITLSARVAHPESLAMLSVQQSARVTSTDAAIALGRAVGNALLAKGADEYLKYAVDS